jgi:hypothetical protein
MTEVTMHSGMNISLDHESSDSNAREMSETFYQEFEGFISGMKFTPPSLSQFQPSKIENMLLSDIPITSKSKTKYPGMLQTKLSSSSTKLKDELHRDHSKHKKQSSSSSTAKVNSINQHVDETLLEEAFKYHRIAEMVKERDASPSHHLNREENERRAKSSSSVETESKPNPSIRQHTPTGTKLKGASCHGLVGKLRSQTQTHSPYQPSKKTNDPKAHFNVSVIPNANIRAVPIDYDSIIENLQSGLNLQILKEELMASQETLDKTKTVMKNIVRDTLYGHGTKS